MNDFERTIITDMSNRGILKILTARDYSTQASVIKKLKEQCGVVIPQPTFSNKVKRDGLKVSELQKICDLYGFDLALCPKK